MVSGFGQKKSPWIQNDRGEQQWDCSRERSSDGACFKSPPLKRLTSAENKVRISPMICSPTRNEICGEGRVAVVSVKEMTREIFRRREPADITEKEINKCRNNGDGEEDGKGLGWCLNEHGRYSDSTVIENKDHKYEWSFFWQRNDD